MKIFAQQRLKASEDFLQLLDPVKDSLDHSLVCLNKAKTANNSRQLMKVAQSIKDALTELQILMEE